LPKQKNLSAMLAKYLVLTPAGETEYSKVGPDVNRYMKWAFRETANAVVLQQRGQPDRHVVRLYQRVYRHNGQAKAITAPDRPLAEAT